MVFWIVCELLVWKTGAQAHPLSDTVHPSPLPGFPAGPAQLHPSWGLRKELRI